MKTIYIDKENIGKWKARRIAKNLYKQSKKEDIVIALSKNLMEHEVLNNALNEYGIKVLNDRWLFKFLIFDILNFVAKMKEERLEVISIAILMDKVDEIILQQIPIISKSVKNLKIITKSKISYSYIENELFEKDGIAIQITNNKEKSLLNVDIILNFDFNGERISEYKINHNAILINLGKKIEINKDIFKGKIINDYDITFDEENYDIEINKNNFEKNILYESYIFRRDTFENIQKQLKKDELKIRLLK